MEDFDLDTFVERYPELADKYRVQVAEVRRVKDGGNALPRITSFAVARLKAAWDREIQKERKEEG
jgi:hypothetical protein